MIRGVEGPRVFRERGTRRDRVGIDDTKARKRGRNALSSSRTALLKPKPGLSAPLIFLRRHWRRGWLSNVTTASVTQELCIAYLCQQLPMVYRRILGYG
jgi:hypothetical protein